MAYIDNSVILNSNLSKKLRIAFDQLKTNYTESAAKEYMDQYKDQSLHFILENSRYIFSEPMFGYKFYTEYVIDNPNAFLFTEYENEKEKISEFIEENGRKMPDLQKEMYDKLLSLVTEKYQDTRGTAIVLEHAFSDDTVKEKYNLIAESALRLSKPENAEEESKKIVEYMESVNNADLFYALTPYIASLENMRDGDSLVSYNIGNYFQESSADGVNENNWKLFCESITILSTLYRDKVYVEAVDSLSRRNKTLFRGIATESLKDQVDELFIEHVSESASGMNPFNTSNFDCFYSTPSNAVNRIFDDDDTYELMKDDNEAFKMERTKLNDIAMQVLCEYVTNEYYDCDDVNANIQGYNFFEDGTTIEEAFLMISEAVSGTPSETVASHSTSLREEGNASKKVNAPEAKNLANKVQFKAMDAEAKQLKKQSVREQKGQEIKNAVKAVTNIPMNVVNSIKSFMKKWDEADDERRKKYIIEPGFRKKAFRNLKLAIMYGATASVKITMLPVVFMARHFSKQKNIRIRNELARELDTEIKICDEKISDAAANGDQQQKYKLMRIKSSLEKEALRVKTNSKYI